MKVLIPKSLMLTIQRVTNIDGHYDDNGTWISGTENKSNIKAFFAPFGSKEIKDYPQGMIELGDMDVRTKTKLNKQDKLIINGEKWVIVDRIDYNYLADLGFYVARRSDKDG